MNNETKDSGPDNNAPTILGWLARLISLIALITLVTTVAWQMISEDKPIQFSSRVVTNEIRQQNGGWIIPVDITNDGSRTASSVDIELEIGGEKTNVEINMIGAQESTQIYVSREKPMDSVSHRIISYELP